MGVKGSAARKSKTVDDGLSIDDAFEAAMGAMRLRRMKKSMVAPENSSCRSTVAGPVAAAKLCGKRLKEFL